jgi:hypothetical protein
LRSFVAFSFTAGVALSVVLAACGGAAPSDLLTPPGTDDHTGSSSSGSGPSDATTVQEESSNSEPDSGGDDDAFAPMEAGPEEAMAEAAPETGPPSGLSCTNGTTKTYCQGTDICCITSSVFSTTATCGSSATCLGSNVKCASAADCTGNQVCCLSEVSAIATTYDATCAATCTGLGKSELCNPGGGPNSGCTGGETCTASTTLSGYSECH